MISAARLDRRLDRVTQVIATIGFTGLVVMALLTMFDALLRWWNLPRISGFDDYGQVVFAVVIASCFPAGLKRGHNVTIRFLGSALGRKSSNLLELFGSVVTLIFFSLVAWQFFEYTVDLQSAGRYTPTIELPIAPWWWVATTVISLSVPVQAWVVIDHIRNIMAGRPVTVGMSSVD